jgi:polar amino acid transport system substrate-binding protein
MKVLFCSILLLVATPLLAEREILNLGNEPWPPYVLSGDDKGTAELIVCGALDRSGWDCDIALDDWEKTLQQASSGELDGIAAVWHTPERAESLLYSRPYLTNRLVPVYSSDLELNIREVGDLSGLRVVTEVKVAYGEKIMTALERLSVEQVRGVENTLRAVQSEKADVALVDELSARDLLSDPEFQDLVTGQTALAFRELYFAVSKKHPSGAEIIASFNESYQTMLKDGSVNRILDIDWVVTDLKFDGIPDFIHRGGGNALSADNSGTVYPVGQKDYKMISQPGFTSSNANFQVNGAGQNPTGGTGTNFTLKEKCFYDNRTARIVCPRR